MPRLNGRLAGVGDADVASRLAAAGLSAPALSGYFSADSGGREPTTRGLMLGYAAVPDDMIDAGPRRMAEVLRI